MKITVEMSDEEFLLFKEYQKDKSTYQQKTKAVHERLEYFAQETCWALNHDPNRPGKVKIVDQSHAQELLELATDYFYTAGKDTRQ